MTKRQRSRKETATNRVAGKEFSLFDIVLSLEFPKWGELKIVDFVFKGSVLYAVLSDCRDGISDFPHTFDQLRFVRKGLPDTLKDIAPPPDEESTATHSATVVVPELKSAAAIATGVESDAKICLEKRTPFIKIVPELWRAYGLDLGSFIAFLLDWERKYARPEHDGKFYCPAKSITNVTGTNRGQQERLFGKLVKYGLISLTLYEKGQARWIKLHHDVIWTAVTEHTIKRKATSAQITLTDTRHLERADRLRDIIMRHGLAEVKLWNDNVRERWARVITGIDDIDVLLTFYDAYAHEYSHFNLPKITSAKHLSSSKVQAWLRNRLEKAKKQGAIEERSGGKIKCHAWNVKARDLEEGQLAEWEQW